jgi:hypothetical protein
MRLSSQCPSSPGWHVKASVTVIAADGQANVIVSSEPLDPRYDTQAYAESQATLLRREFSGFREFSTGPYPFLGLQGVVRWFEWSPPDGVPVTQIQAYYAAGGRGYTSTATTTAAAFQGWRQAMEFILGGIRLRPAGSAPDPLPPAPPPMPR